MTVRITNLPYKSLKSALYLAFLGSVAMAAPLFAAGGAAPNGSGEGQTSQSKLIEIVQESTRQYANVNAATRAGYEPLFGCVSGPDQGAMGIHYINGALLNGEVDATKPQALIYEPSDGTLQLVGVEFIVDQATWDKYHSAPPQLEGQAFQLVASPNRFGIATFYELHVWAWRNNPLGAYVDWNTKVSCTGE